MTQHPHGHAFIKTKENGNPQLGTLQEYYCGFTCLYTVTIYSYSTSVKGSLVHRTYGEKGLYLVQAKQ